MFYWKKLFFNAFTLKIDQKFCSMFSSSRSSRNHAPFCGTAARGQIVGISENPKKSKKNWKKLKVVDRICFN
jgi:hypothetical protein